MIKPKPAFEFLNLKQNSKYELSTFPINSGPHDDGFRNHVVTTLSTSINDRFGRINRGKAFLSFRELEELSENEFTGFHFDWAVQSIHEAGHAVVAFVLGFTPYFIRINSLRWNWKQSRYESRQDDSLLRTLHEPELSEYIKCVISLKAAGIVAQNILFPLPLDPRGGEFDFHEACFYCKALHNPRRKNDGWTERDLTTFQVATRMAEEIVSGYREATLLLAAESLSKSALAGKRIVEILEYNGVRPRLKEWQ